MNQNYYELFYTAHNIRETDPDEAVRLMQIGRERAIAENNTYWRAEFEHWHLQILMHFKKDYTTANKFAVGAAVEVAKPEYQDFTSSICIPQDMIQVYMGIDPLGYAEPIKEAIDLTIDRTYPGMNCHFCLNLSLVEYFWHTGQREKAKDQIARVFPLTASAPFYRSQVYAWMCMVAYHEQNWVALVELAKQGEQVAAEIDEVSDWIEVKSWEALALYKQGQQDAAAQAYKMIQLRAANLGMVQNDGYYTAISAYLEAKGDFHAAMALLDEQVEHLAHSGQLYWECQCRLQRLRIMKKMEQQLDAELAKFHAAVAKLKSKPALMSELETVLNT